MTASLHALPKNVIAVMSSTAAHGLTEFLRLIYRLLGGDVEPRIICLNSLCGLPVSTLVIDSGTFQRTLTQGLSVLVWVFLAFAALLAIQAVLRTILPGSRTAGFLRQAVTARIVVIALACGIALSVFVAVLGNFRALLRISAPSMGME